MEQKPALTPATLPTMNPGYPVAVPNSEGQSFNTGNPQSSNQPLDRNSYVSELIVNARLVVGTPIIINATGRGALFQVSNLGSATSGWLLAIYFDDNTNPIYWDSKNYNTPAFPAAAGPATGGDQASRFYIGGFVFSKIRIVPVVAPAQDANSNRILQVVTFTNPVDVRWG